MSPTVVDVVLAGLNVDRDLRDAITGDLMEERAVLAAVRGEPAANRWMRQQVLRSVPLLIHASFREGGLRLIARSIGAAIVALAAISLLIAMVATVLSALVSPDAFARWSSVAFTIDLACGVAGGYLAARLGRANPLGAAFCLGVLGVLTTISPGGDMTGWYRPALQLLLTPMAVGGGWLWARQLARRPHPA